MTNQLTLSVATVSFALLTTVVAVAADDADTLNRIDEQLAKLKTFEYAQDGNLASDLERTIFQLSADSPLRDVVEQKLIDALADANSTARGVICRQLRVIGTDKCVPAVAPLLSDPELSSFARYALQGIGSDAALQAMHDALDDVPGKLQVGLLNSLASHNYQPMRGACERLMDADDSHVAAAAIRALGRLGGRESVTALANKRSGAGGLLGRAVDLALLECAAGLLEGGDADATADVYSKLYGQEGPFRLAGLQGLIAAQPDKATDLLIDALRGDERQLAATAANLTVQVTDEQATGRFVAVLGELSDERQLLLIKALGQRGDVAAVPAVAAAAQSSNPALQRAAVDALGGLQGDEAVDALLAAVSEDDPSVQRVARASLVRIDGANAYLAKIARNSVDHTATEAINTLAARKATESTQTMLELARADNAAKRSAAIRALGVLADSQNLGALVGLVVEPTSTDDLPSIEDATGRVLLRIDNPADRETPLLDALTNASDNVRPVLVRLLARAGTTDALRAVRSALKSPDAQTSEAAVAALASWPNPNASGDLISLIESAATPALKRQALEGYVRIASVSDDPSTMFLDGLQKVRGLDARKRILNEIGLHCESFEAIETTQSLFDNPQLRAVAAIATVRMAYKLRRQHKDRVRQILEDVLAEVDHPDVQKRAQDVLNDLDKYQDHILQWVAVGPFLDRNITSGRASYDTVFEPETAAAADLDWKPLTQGIGSWDINLEANYGLKDHCSAYVRTMIYSPRDQDVQIEGGSDDALKIWVNGKQIHEQWRAGGCEPRQVQVPARLHKGWNELKLKVTDHEGGWQFGCRVRKPNGTRLEGLKYEAR